MANPVSLNINELTSNAAVNQAVTQTVDTNGTINCPAKSETFGLLVILTNNAAAAIDVTVKGGTSVAAHTSRDLVTNLGATGSASAIKVLGPLESARFVKPDGSVDLQFQAASGAPNLSVRVYRLPKNV